MAETKTKSDTAHPTQSSITRPRYLNDDVVERYTSTKKDKDKKAIVKEVYERLSADADAELETLSSLGSDTEKIYKETAQNIDQFIEQLIHGNTEK